MTWLIYTGIIAIATALMDFFVKLSSGKINDALGGTVLNLAATIPVLALVLWQKYHGQDILSTKPGITYSILAGVSIGLGTVFLFKLFALGTNLSFASPFIRVSVAVLGVLLGLIYFRESLSPKTIAGLVLSIIGLYLMITGKS